jgi:DnaJ-class molecular chaperone
MGFSLPIQESHCKTKIIEVDDKGLHITGNSVQGTKGEINIRLVIPSPSDVSVTQKHHICKNALKENIKSKVVEKEERKSRHQSFPFVTSVNVPKAGPTCHILSKLESF